MCIKLSRTLSFALCAAFLTFSVQAAPAQTGDAKPPADSSKDAQRQSDEIAEAARAITGPAGNPECVWLGRRVVGLLYRDDVDQAMRQLDMYDRFGCPGPHIQQAFRCVVRQTNIEAKTQEAFNKRVHLCWLNPAMVVQPVAAAPTSPPAAKQ
jgi:hypothetical protein